MMRKIKYRRAGVAGLLFMTVMSACFLTGCVDQHPEGTQTTVQPTETLDSMLQITDPIEKEAVEIAKAKVHSMGAEPRIIATSPYFDFFQNRVDKMIVELYNLFRKISK